jgi:hypothetical protein
MGHLGMWQNRLLGGLVVLLAATVVVAVGGASIP